MYLERQFDSNIFLHTYVYSNFPLITQVKYSQVPIKRVGPNKRIRWLFWGLEGAFKSGAEVQENQFSTLLIYLALLFYEI